jgi:hypothetical protein
MLRTLASRAFAQRGSLIKMLPSMVYQTRNLKINHGEYKYFYISGEEIVNERYDKFDEGYKIVKNMATKIMASGQTDKILMGKCLIQSKSDKPNYQATVNFHNDIITINLSKLQDDCQIDLDSLMEYPLNKHYDINGKYKIVYDDKGICDMYYKNAHLLETTAKDNTNPIRTGNFLIKSNSNTPNYRCILQTFKGEVSMIFEKIQCNKIPT